MTEITFMGVTKTQTSDPKKLRPTRCIANSDPLGVLKTQTLLCYLIFMISWHSVVQNRLGSVFSHVNN